MTAIVVYGILLYMEVKERRHRFRAAVEKIAVPLGFNADVLEAQAAHETNNFISIPGNSYNCFGIRWYGTRKELPYVEGFGLDGKKKYAAYRGWEHGIEEYCSVVERIHPPAYKVRHIPVKYISVLAKSWCPVDKDYDGKWLNHFVKIKNEERETALAKIETERKGVSLMAKSGIKSSESWLTLLVIILGGLLSTGIIGDGSQAAQYVGGAIVILKSLGYTASRTILKSGDNGNA